MIVKSNIPNLLEIDLFDTFDLKENVLAHALQTAFLHGADGDSLIRSAYRRAHSLTIEVDNAVSICT